jgi:hypothetical protein
MRTLPIKAQIRQRVRILKEKTERSDPSLAANPYSSAARRLQARFNEIPKNRYRRKKSFELVITLAALRELAHRHYKEQEDLKNAAMELSLAAGCLNDYAGRLVLQPLEKTDNPAIGQAIPVEILKESLNWNFSIGPPLEAGPGI